MPRVTRENWLTAALTLLKMEGPSGLTIERLCAVMHKTKGSFYHHFGSAEGLRNALLDRWEARQTSAFIEAADAAGDVRARRAVLERVAAAADWDEERAVRAWGWRDTSVRERVDAIDQRRVQYLASLYPSASPERAHQLALIEYAALIGAQHLFLPAGTKNDALSTLLLEALSAKAAESAL